MSEIERTVDRFYELISPQIFFEGWTDSEFKEWAELGDNIELRNLLIILEVHEKYEYCKIVKDILNQRNDVNSDSIGV